MKTPRTFLVTGATSGLGLEAVRALTTGTSHRVIVGARQPRNATALDSLERAGRVTILPLDTSSFRSVSQFARDVRSALAPGERVAGLACNAGLQMAPGRTSEDGYELTFATNYLGHFQLVHELLPALAPGAAVVSTASGTHDPKDRLATRFNFRGGVFPSAEAVSRGELDAKASADQTGRDLYATSKLCNILFTMEMARRISPSQARFIAFDPGLMPGTNLAREAPAAVRFVWYRILPTVGPLWPGISSVRRSGKALANLLTDTPGGAATGLHFDYRLRQTKPSVDALRPDLAAALYSFSRRAGISAGLTQDWTSGSASAGEVATAGV